MVSQRQPIFNIPPATLALGAVLTAIHLLRQLLSPEADHELLLTFAFIPVRFDATLVLGGPLPGGTPARLWSFVTYAFLHGNATHLIFNLLWLLPFGSGLERRFGPARYLVFLAVTAAAGALVHLLVHPHTLVLMVGASAAISGAMAASARFAFQRGSFLGGWRDMDPVATVPAVPLRNVWRDPRIFAFLAVWLGLNILFGTGTLSMLDQDSPVAWEAHLGGFFAGLFLFGLFDPPRAPSAPDSAP